MGSDNDKKEDESSQKQKHEPDIVSDTIVNSIVKIGNNINNEIGNGFFMKVYIDNIKLKFLLTCYHIISQDLVDKEEVINIIFKQNKENIMKIKLGKLKRIIKCFQLPIDVTFFQILDGDCISDDMFLSPDFNFKKGYAFYENKNILSAGYLTHMKGDICISSGKINKIKTINSEIFEFENSLDKGHLSSGSPIFLSDSKCVIGINKGSNKVEPIINYGTFIGGLLEKIVFEKKQHNNNLYYNNFINQYNYINTYNNMNINNNYQKKMSSIQSGINHVNQFNYTKINNNFKKSNTMNNKANLYNNEEINVIFETASGRKINTLIKKTATINELFLHFYSRSGIPILNTLFIFQGKTLSINDKRRIMEIGINNLALITCLDVSVVIGA